MPPAVHRAGTELKIVLDYGRPCQSGSVITGSVVRTAPGVSPRATVSIRLLGRAKTKIIVTRSTGQGTSRSYYRNRFNFFEPTQTRQFLFDGPLHIAPGPAGDAASWPFSIHVPLSPTPRALRSEGGGNADTSFLSLRPEDIASSRLPASFVTEGRHRYIKFEAYVEYQLEATLMTSGNHGKDVTAVLPIQMRGSPMQNPLSDFEIHRRSMQSSVSTYNLVPGMHNVELSFKQKAKQVLGSSKVPMFGYILHVDCPAVIQLWNPTPIPFSIRIVPDRRRTSEVIHDVDQTVALTSLELVLKAHTAVIAPTTFSSQKGHDILKRNIPLPVAALGQIANPPVGTETPPDGKGKGDVQSTENASSTSSSRQPYGLLLPSKWGAGDETALDIGAAMDLRLFSTHATAFCRPIGGTSMGGGTITPGFETYCIRHEHTLKWKVVLQIAGKTTKHESEQTVTIVGPSEAPPALAATTSAQMGTNFEELPPYGPSAEVGGPSTADGAANALAEELPSYTK